MGREIIEKENSPWFTYKDERGYLNSIHIPNLYKKIDNIELRIKKLEEKK